MLRTTCVTTMVEAGHAPNALPQRAAANVNCRILPGEDPEEVLRTLIKVANSPKVTITPVDAAKPSPPSPLTPEIMQAITRVTEEMWPGVPVIPFMSTGATDGLYFRQAGIPIYGVSGLFGDMDDVRAHGRDERMGVKEFFDGQEFLWWLVNALSGARKSEGTETRATPGSSSFSVPSLFAKIAVPAAGVRPCRERLFLGSSTVEHPAVNRRVAGSNPARGAKSLQNQ